MLSSCFGLCLCIFIPSSFKTCGHSDGHRDVRYFNNVAAGWKNESVISLKIAKTPVSCLQHFGLLTTDRLGYEASSWEKHPGSYSSYISLVEEKGLPGECWILVGEGVLCWPVTTAEWQTAVHHCPPAKWLRLRKHNCPARAGDLAHLTGRCCPPPRWRWRTHGRRRAGWPEGTTYCSGG